MSGLSALYASADGEVCGGRCMDVCSCMAVTSRYYRRAIVRKRT